MNISEELHKLVVEQREELQNGQFQPIFFGTEEELFEWSRKNDMFKEAYEEFKEYLLMPLTDKKFNKLKGEFVGTVFQNIAYNSLVDMQSQSSILLSPDRTLEFYKKLHPGKHEKEYPFGLDSIEGVSVPDGIVVERSDGIERIVKVYEYTLEKDDQYFVDKDNGFFKEREYLQQLLGDYFQQLFGDAHLLFVVPKGHYSNIPRNSEELPFAHEQFEDFVKHIYYHKQTENSKTLFDIQKRHI